MARAAGGRPSASGGLDALAGHEQEARQFQQHLTEANRPVFRRTPLALGEHNWPDKPFRQDQPWYRGLPLKEKVLGVGTIARQLTTLYRLKARGLPLRRADYVEQGVGKPCGYWLPGLGWVTDASIRQGHYTARIRQLVHPAPASVFEIGAGFGGLAARLMSALPIKHYIITDLPEGLTLAWSYLKEYQATLAAPFDVELVRSPEQGRRAPTHGRRITLIPPWYLAECLPRVALLINTMSFQHMSRDNLAYYCGLIETTRPRALYLVNRNFTIDPSDVPMDRYPLPKGYRLTQQAPYPFGFAEERLYELMDGTTPGAA